MSNDNRFNYFRINYARNNIKFRDYAKVESREAALRMFNERKATKGYRVISIEQLDKADFRRELDEERRIFREVARQAWKQTPPPRPVTEAGNENA